MTEMTDDEIWEALNGPQMSETLFERAKAAALEKKAETEADQAAEVEELRREAVAMMKNILGLPDNEINAALAGLKSDTHDAKRMRVEFEADRWWFRVRYQVKPIYITNGGEKIQAGEEFIPTYEYRHKQAASWKTFKELADIVSGMAL